MAQFVEERWEDVTGEEEGVNKALTEDFGFLFASQVFISILASSIVWSEHLLVVLSGHL